MRFYVPLSSGKKPPKSIVFFMLTTEERSMPAKEFRSSGEQEFRGRVIVLIDESSASGSEVVAGA